MAPSCGHSSNRGETTEFTTTQRTAANARGARNPDRQRPSLRQDPHLQVLSGKHEAFKAGKVPSCSTKRLNSLNKVQMRASQRS